LISAMTSDSTVGLAFSPMATNTLTCRQFSVKPVWL
jgi:hypothetical protein